MAYDSFADLFAEAETDPAYLAAGVAIEFTLSAQRAMEAQGVSRAELARRIGTSQAYVSKLFGGSANFTIETMVKIASALGMTMVPTLGHRPVMAWPEDLGPRCGVAHAHDDSAYGSADEEPSSTDGMEYDAFYSSAA
ncbi:MAG: helix-turn-helix domain-containing protein [Alphaproteobacteria bacterium]|jgi:transcriptional regulator with XRE-family HTH domain|nr:helix-turn-helix domain-containing protein [Alphaproteobacteria bacterium]